MRIHWHAGRPGLPKRGKGKWPAAGRIPPPARPPFRTCWCTIKGELPEAGRPCRGQKRRRDLLEPSYKTLIAWSSVAPTDNLNCNSKIIQRPLLRGNSSFTENLNLGLTLPSARCFFPNTNHYTAANFAQCVTTPAATQCC